MIPILSHIHLQEITKKILKGSFWVLTGSAISKVLVFCATIIVVHILSKETYGQLGIIRSTIQMFIAISSFGIGSTTSKYIAQYRIAEHANVVKVYLVANIFTVTIAILMGVCIIIFAPYIAINSLNAPELTDDIKIGGVILVFSLLNGAQTGTLSGFEDFKRLAKSNIVSGISEIILLSVGAWLWGLKGAIVGFGLTYCIAWLYNAYYIRIHIRSLQINILENLQQLKPKDFNILYKFSLPIAMTSWIDMPAYWWAKTYMIKNAGFSEMATYDISDQWRGQVLFLPMIIGNVILPIMSSSVAANNQSNTLKAVKTNIMLNASITFGCSLIILLLAPYIMMIYGKEFTDYTPLYILCFAGAVDSISNACGTTIIAHNKAWSVLVFNIVWALSIIGLSFYLINKMHNATGLALAYLFSNCILTTLMLIKTSRLLKYGPFDKTRI